MLKVKGHESTIKELWLRFLEGKPKHFPEDLIPVMEKAFYCGAIAATAVIMSAEELPNNEACTRIENINNELADYATKIVDEEAGLNPKDGKIH